MIEKYILVDVEPEDLGFTVISKKYKKVLDFDNNVNYNNNVFKIKKGAINDKTL